MSFPRLLSILFIFVGATIGWGILGQALHMRTERQTDSLSQEVEGVWGPPMTQPHLRVHYSSPASPGGKKHIAPAASAIRVQLTSDPKKRGLLWHRTYDVDFAADYSVQNDTPIAQTFTIHFDFPAAAASYTGFSFTLDGKQSTQSHPAAEDLTEAVLLQPGAQTKIGVQYHSRGVDSWQYAFGETNRVRNFRLDLATSFPDINFPAATGSPTTRAPEGPGWKLAWEYPDVIGARGIGMDMPAVLNPGPVATRIAFFAPISLLFYFTIVTLAAILLRVPLHPMNFFFLAASFFAFQLLFSYLVDLVPLHVAFGIAAATSLALAGGYLAAATGRRFAILSTTAQFAYLILFSYTFFFHGLTGITITIGSIATLAVLMATTARTDWSQLFSKPATDLPQPPPLPATDWQK